MYKKTVSVLPAGIRNPFIPVNPGWVPKEISESNINNECRKELLSGGPYERELYRIPSLFVLLPE